MVQDVDVHLNPDFPWQSSIQQWRIVVKSHNGQEYPTKNKKKESDLGWSNVA